MRRSKRRRKPLGEDDVLRAVVCDYVGPAECAINAEAGYTTAVASRAGLVARHTGPQRERRRVATTRRKPRRARRGMRDKRQTVRPGQLSRPREPERPGRARERGSACVTFCYFFQIFAKVKKNHTRCALNFGP